MNIPQGSKTALTSEAEIDAICERAKEHIFAKVMKHYQKNPGSAWSGSYLVDLEKSVKAMYAQWGVNIGNEFKKSLPKTMREFYDRAAKEIRTAGKRKAILGEPDPKRISFFLNNSFEEIAMRTTKMSFEHVRELRKISAEVLRESSLTGATRAAVSKQMLERAMQIPGFEFRDKSGRVWPNKTYFKMLARTELMNAGRASYADKCAEEGYDVCVLDSSGGACDKCAPYEGKLFSLTGATAGLPTLADLEAAGVFHPNCTHSYSAVPDYIRLTEYNADGTPKDGSESAEVPEVPVASPLPEPVKAPEYKPFPDDLSQMKELPVHIGGSTGAKLVEDQYGNKFILKTGGNAGGESAGHLRNECAADGFYREMSINVPEYRLYETPDGPVKLSQFIDGGQSLGNWWGSATPEEREAMRAKLEPGFKADVITGNWDVVGMSQDNILIDRDGTPWRIDNGGALRYRAQGAEKAAKDWATGMPDDLWTMRTSSNNREFFEQISDRKLIGDIAGSDWQKALEALPPEERKVVEKRLKEVRLLDSRYRELEQEKIEPVKADRLVRRTYDRTGEFIADGYTREHVDNVNSNVIGLAKQRFDEHLPREVSMYDYGYLRSDGQTARTSPEEKQNTEIQNSILSAAKSINHHNAASGDHKPNEQKIQAAIDLKPELLLEAKKGNAAAAYYLRQIETLEAAAKNGTVMPNVDVSIPVYSTPIATAPTHRSATEEIHQYMTRNSGDPQFIINAQAGQAGNSYNPDACKMKIVHLKSMGIEPEDAEKSGYFIGLPGSAQRYSFDQEVERYQKHPAQLEKDLKSYQQYHAAIQQILETTSFEGNDQTRKVLLLGRTENKEVVTNTTKNTPSNHKRGVNESHSIFQATTVCGDQLTMVEVPYSRVSGVFMLERTPGSNSCCFLGDQENEITADTNRLPILYIGKCRSGESLEEYRQQFLMWKKKNNL